jgi:dipeptidyl aminopeptidase/acylaminoacyl peptidase
MKAGDIWLVQTGETGTDAIRRITKDGNYRTPLWHPGGQSILAMKDRNKLVQLNTQGSKEVQLHAFATKNTVLIGFDRSNPDRVLVQQEPLVGVLSLANGKITPLPYDPKNAKDREALDQLNSDTRYYGNIIVSIVDQAVVDLKGRAQTIYTIKIDNNVNDIAIKCPSVCSQPALSSDGRQLLFIDH